MSGWLSYVSNQVAQTWTNMYTRGLPVERRDARRAELASDLWEHTHDEPARRTGVLCMAILGRVLAGVPSDIVWRVEVRAGSTLRNPSYGHPIVIALLVALTAMVALVGLPGPAAAIVAVLVALKPIGRMRMFAWSPDGDARREDISANISTSQRRITLLIVLGMSLVIIASSYVYVTSLSSWGNTEALMSLALGWSSLAVAVTAAVMLVVDITRARRH